MFGQSDEAVNIYLQSMKQLLLNATYYCIVNSQHCFGIAGYVINAQKGKEGVAAAVWLSIGKLYGGKVWWESTLSVEGEIMSECSISKCKDKAAAHSKPETE